ncbi:hypothetical protein MASR2M18_11210 [Ignavibacteria bacterium]|nr:hypothetical protein [Bacteroidota bacterium]MCZ2133346.1 hypothetical protein [Bacteroidota bacterium]
MLLLSIVTDDELLTSQIVKAILLVLLCGGIIYNLYRVIRHETRIRRIINACILFLLVVATFIVSREFVFETSLLNEPKFTEGITIGYCNVFGRGEGIEFEYEADGVKYRCCNTFHPVSKDSIKVPDGKYKVRYTDKYKDKGRMIFKPE